MTSIHRNQKTIAAPAAVQGIGYWSGEEIVVEFRPAKPDAGISFVRRDLPGSPSIPALVGFRTDTPRRTDLAQGDVRVSMVEHVLASLKGMEIDNCEIHVTAAEMPGCDGSAKPFVTALREVGTVEQPARRRQCVVQSTIRVGDEEKWIEITPPADGESRLCYILDYGEDNPIGRQTAHAVLRSGVFAEELSSARTFLLEAEALWLQEQGLGTRITPRDLLVFGDNGLIDNTLRYSNECARHKLLDLVGDLTLAGCDLIGDITAYRSGHHLNAELVRTVLAAGSSDMDDLRRCA